MSMILTQINDETKRGCRERFWKAVSYSRISKEHETIITLFSLEATSAFSLPHLSVSTHVSLIRSRILRAWC